MHVIFYSLNSFVFINFENVLVSTLNIYLHLHLLQFVWLLLALVSATTTEL